MRAHEIAKLIHIAEGLPVALLQVNLAIVLRQGADASSIAELPRLPTRKLAA
jgi:hypothetical protein